MCLISTILKILKKCKSLYLFTLFNFFFPLEVCFLTISYINNPWVFSDNPDSKTGVSASDEDLMESVLNDSKLLEEQLEKQRKIEEEFAERKSFQADAEKVEGLNLGTSCCLCSEYWYVIIDENIALPFFFVQNFRFCKCWRLGWIDCFQEWVWRERKT